MLLEETGFAAAGRAANDRQRTIDDVGQHPVGDLGVILGQIALRDPLIGIQNLVGMREAHAREFVVSGGRSRWLPSREGFAGAKFAVLTSSGVRRGRCRLRIALTSLERNGLVVDDLAGRLVLAKPLERRMPKQPFVGPVRELDLGDELGFDPRNVSRSPVVPERFAKGDVLARELCQLLVQRRQRLLVESRADPARIDELLARGRDSPATRHRNGSGCRWAW